MTLRNLPREAIHDPPELFVWLNRLAKALERARDTPMPASQAAAWPSSPAPTLPAPPRALSVRERAEAVFSTTSGTTSETTPAETSPSEAVQGMPMMVTPSRASALPRPRIVMDKQGRGVRVEVRRAREAGQMEMFGQP